MTAVLLPRSPASRIAAWAVLGLLAAACSTGAPASHGAKADTCAAHTTAARDKLLAVIDANSTCTADADCTHVELAAACFDSCSRSIAASGKAAFDAERAAVDEANCKAYDADACPPHISPPCAPPGPPTCQEGKCI